MRERNDGRGRQGIRLLGALCCVALLCGAAQNGITEDSPNPTPTPTPSPQHIASIEGRLEAAIDAPWRLEPDPSSTPRYPVIPIVLTVHDAHMRGNDNNPAVGQFCELVIREETAAGPAATLHRYADSIDELERSGVWLLNLPAENHRLCRPSRGEHCPDDLVVGTSAEWHATFLYVPQTQQAGADVRLTVQARFSRYGNPVAPCGPSLPIIDAASFDRIQPPPPPYDQNTSDFIITNRLSVHLGEEPLPRFDDGYVYGDLHYHSQGTDNEGESAYAYRPTLQAMRALGLDFLFATDHASAGTDGQITDVDMIHIANIDIPGWVPFDEEIQKWLRSLPLHESLRSDAARDLNPTRFAAMRKLLNDPPGSSAAVPTGANAEVMTFPGLQRAARIFLGGEVDVVPEMSYSEAATSHIAYGNGRHYPWRSGCNLAERLKEILNGILDIRLGTDICDNTDELAVARDGGSRYLLRDLQGDTDTFFARQHLVHLPTDGTSDAFDDFIASNTSYFGGATRRLGPPAPVPGDEDLLDSILYRELEVGKKGYAFLAHPVEAESGDGVHRLGPDIVPYSEVQLRDAFQSPFILGLQLWNEDTRLASATEPTPSVPGFPLQPGDAGSSFTRWHWGRWLGPAPAAAYRDLHDGIAAWEKMLLWGIRSSQTAGLRDTDGEFLAPGEPRRVFMAGGSDAHGDWNYRRQGRMVGVTGIVDTAIGKPRNLVYVGPSRAETVTGQDGTEYGAVGQKQVTSALATGNFSVTDGPALRIAVDVNKNGVIDAGDVPMGGFANAPSRGAYVPFIVEWKSSEEFGPVASIDLYVGVANDTVNTVNFGVVYASRDHGVHSPQTRSGAVSPNPYVDSHDALHWELHDGYLLDPTGTSTTFGKLRIVPSAAEAEANAGRRTVLLRANDFPVGVRRVEYHPETDCAWNDPICGKTGQYYDGCEQICTGPPPELRFDHVSLPDRMFVRAFARTARKGGTLCASTGAEDDQQRDARRTGQCIERLAFTNPVWVDNTTAPPPPGNFGIVCTPASLGADNGGSATSTCKVTSVNDFSKPVSLSCTNLPSGTGCSFNPPTLTPPANGSASSTLTVSVGPTTAPGSYGIRAKASATTAHTHDTGIALAVAGWPALAASFDSELLAPSCGAGVLGRSCETSGRDVFSRAIGGREPNTPNTIGASCADGESGPASGKWTAIDHVKVSATDGGFLATGRTARIDATVWASGTPSADRVDFFYAADAGNPVWRLIGTAVPRVAGAQAMSMPYQLPVGSLQAVRVQFRTGGTSAACTPSDTADRDDLIFGPVGAERPR